MKSRVFTCVTGNKESKRIRNPRDYRNPSSTLTTVTTDVNKGTGRKVPRIGLKVGDGPGRK